MVITNLLIVGAIAYSGVKTYLKRRSPQEEEPVVIEGASDISPIVLEWQQQREEQQKYVNLSALSLGLTVTGSFFYPPLVVLSAPISVYTTVPLLDRSFDTFFGDEQDSGAVFGSVVMMGSLVARQYLIASMIDWTRQRLQLLRGDVVMAHNELTRETLSFAQQSFGQKPEKVWVRQEDGEYEIPYEQLQVGDTIVVGERQFVAVEGVVVEGTAVVVDFLNISYTLNTSQKLPNDPVHDRMFVLSGTIAVRVQKR